MRSLLLVALLCGCRKPAPLPPPARTDLAIVAPTDVTTLDGKPVAFASYRKKVTFVAIWATFCHPCMEELPMVQALAKKLAGDPDVAVLAVSADEIQSDADRAHVAEVAQSLGLTIPVLLDERGLLSARYAVAYGTNVQLPDGGDPDTDISLPTAVIQLTDGRYSREVGFEQGVTQDRYVESHAAAIEAAKNGALAPEQPERADDQQNAEMIGQSTKMRISAMTRAQYRTEWPTVRARLKQLLHLDSAQLAAADEQAKNGQPVIIDTATTPPRKRTAKK